MDYIDIASMINKAILYEVSTTPKPGLVDRNNNGAHDDMDYLTFMSSASSIASGFYKIAEHANEFIGSPKALFESIRPIGMAMEKKMFDATAGVNTHKGIIFSLGVLCAASVVVLKQNELNVENIINYASSMTVGLTDELNMSRPVEMTHGERLYFKYGITGIRGEVEAGFPSVTKTGLDVLRKSYYTLQCKNDLFVQVLFALMTCVEDSNILSRHDSETLMEVQKMAKEFLDSGGMIKKNGLERVKVLDDLFIERRISPGGSADLLAVTLYLGMIENLID